MFLKKFAVVFFLWSIAISARAQSDDFCEAVNTILRDAPALFRNVKGKSLGETFSSSTWASSIKVPGTIGERFVSSMGLFYEGAVYQSKTKDGLKAVYEQYKAKLSACLMPQNYKMSLLDNFYAGVGEYKKVVFMQVGKEENGPVVPPPHVTMEVNYNKEIGSYTIVIFIFNH